MRIKDVILGIAIIILTIFVTFYAINTVFPKPDYRDYCNLTSSGATYTTQSLCEANGGYWNPTVGPKAAGQVEGYCDLYYYCNMQYESLVKERSKKVFFLALPLGIAVVVTGAFFFGLEAVGAGLMGGGVGTLIYGAGAYWPYTQNWIRFVLSLAGLALLIWFAYFLQRRMKKRKR